MGQEEELVNLEEEELEEIRNHVLPVVLVMDRAEEEEKVGTGNQYNGCDLGST